jgi:hypothetical protein
MYNSFYQHLELKPSHGIGVFAGKDFTPTEIVEIAPCIHDHSKDSCSFLDYVFNSHVAPYHSTLILGYGSLYNHADDPNLKYYSHGPRFIIFTACKPIQKGEELTISYGDNWWKDRQKNY